MPSDHQNRPEGTTASTRERRVIRFGLVGTGWRARFFARVARLIPERFELAGVVTRSAPAVGSVWGVPAYRRVEELVAGPALDYVVACVPRTVVVSVTSRLVELGQAVLVETPPASDQAGLEAVTALAADGGRVQVAENYPWQPLHAARLAMTDAGLIGPVHQAVLSVAHDYHAFALMRRYLRVAGAPATISATTTTTPVQVGAARTGPRAEPGTTTTERTHALVDFGDRVGVYDFAGTQYWSYVHRHHVLLRGRDGEIADEQITRVSGSEDTLSDTFTRQATGTEGNMAGTHLRGIAAAGQWWWRNPFPGARLFDDEVAVATLMELMARYASGGPAFYGAADAAQDTYLTFALRRSAATGEPVRTTRQPWDDQLQPPDRPPTPPEPVLVDRGPWLVPLPFMETDDSRTS